MAASLEGLVALVTGAGSGIGRATAERFAWAGARVTIVDLDGPAGEATAAAIGNAGGVAIAVAADMQHAAEVESAVRRTAQHFGRLDVLFNGAGISGRRWGDGPVADCSEDAWDRVMAVNLKSVFLGCKYAIPEMLRGGAGAIVNLSSVLALVGGDADFATHAYAASKGGIISLTRSIAAYYAPQGIRANVVCPGLIATAMSQRAQSDTGIRARLTQLQPLTGTFGQPEDVAGAAVFLASHEAHFITGVVLPVDGGWTVF